MPSRSIQVAANGIISFSFTTASYSTMSLSPYYLSPFICWQTFRLFPYLSYCKQMLLWTLGGMYLFEVMFSFSSDIPNHRIVRSYSCSIFNFLRNIHNVFQSDGTNLQSHQQNTKVPFPHNLASICYLWSFEW